MRFSEFRPLLEDDFDDLGDYVEDGANHEADNALINILRGLQFSAGSMKMPKNLNPDSPYKDITNKVVAGVKMMAEMGTPPSEVAEVIIKAINEKNPLPRYPVGNDAIMFLEAKKMKTDIEFENYLKKELF